MTDKKPATVEMLDAELSKAVPHIAKRGYEQLSADDMHRIAWMHGVGWGIEMAIEAGADPELLIDAGAGKYVCDEQIRSRAADQKGLCCDRCPDPMQCDWEKSH